MSKSKSKSTKVPGEKTHVKCFLCGEKKRVGYPCAKCFPPKTKE